VDKQCRCEVSRRQFLMLAGGAAACCAFLPAAEAVLADEPVGRTPIYPKGKARVGLILSHIPSGSPTWPAKDYDYAARAKELTSKLVNGCPNVEFVPRTAHNVDMANAVLNELADVDGYVVYNLGIWTSVPNTVIHSGKPVVMADDLYAGSGETLICAGVATREKLPVVTVSSSDLNDVISAARLFGVIRAMQDSTILDIVDYDIAAAAEQVKKAWGPTVVRIGSKELADYYARTEEREGAKWGAHWRLRAKETREPTPAEVNKSGRMYLALSQAMRDVRADAVTMDCLGMFYSGLVSAYPCLSHFQMNNDGSTGVCEGDLNSTCTQLAMRYMTGRPGYVSDPVIDTSKDEIVYAHCVSHNRPFGPKGKSNAYIIRSHAEDGQGASVQSLLPAGEVVTTLETDVWSKAMVIHTAKTTRNVDDPKACRTKLAARTDSRRILDNWGMGWHRVTVYGDWRRDAMDLAKLVGFTVTEEDRA